MSSEKILERAYISIEKLRKIGIHLNAWEKSVVMRAAEILSRALMEAKVDFPPGHDVEHMFRVMELAIFLYKKYGGDFEKIVLAALLHDIMRTKKNHAEESARFVLGILRSTIFAKKAHDVAKIIREHSYSSALTPSSIESQILQDADRLDALGAIGVARVFSYGAHKRRPLYDISNLKNKETSLGHFYDKILRLPTLMNTDLARRIAERRVEVIRRFIDTMILEISLGDLDI